jgi:2-polyprenyl-3-methyl-5-hydroxy-6-metoxy-1,4-benzoquinol methylase
MKSDSSNRDSYSSNFRRRRMEWLARLIEQKGLKGMSVLDVGGTQKFWGTNPKYLPKGAITEIDIVNLPPSEAFEVELNGIILRSYAGDALDASTFRKDNYDLVLSNSVIEHVGNLSSESQMAEAIVKLRTCYWVQSLAKSFPLEPHFYFPFFAYLPLALRAALLRRFDLGFHKRE